MDTRARSDYVGIAAMRVCGGFGAEFILTFTLYRIFLFLADCVIMM